MALGAPAMPPHELGRRASPLLLSCISAALLLSLLAAWDGSSVGSGLRSRGAESLAESAEEDGGRRGWAAEELRRLAMRRVAGGQEAEGLRAEGLRGGRVRLALKGLEHTLKGEEQGMQEVLDAVKHAKGAPAPRAEGSGGAKDFGDDHEIPDVDEDWKKKTIQRGVLKNESVDKQLKRVLEKELEQKLKKTTQWKSLKDLEEAQNFADYMKKHPLPDDYIRNIVNEEQAQKNGVIGDEEQSPSHGKRYQLSDQDGDVVVTIKFHRNPEGLTSEQYKKIQEAVSAAEEHMEDEDSKTSPASTKSTAMAADGRRSVRQSVLRKQLVEGERRMSARATSRDTPAGFTGMPVSEGTAYAHGKTDTESDQIAHVLRRGARGNKEFDPVEASSKVQYVESPLDIGTRPLQGLSAKKRQQIIEDEVLREHGNFVHLPTTSAPLRTLAVRPYWDDALGRHNH